MKYVVFIKDDIAVAKAIFKNLDTVDVMMFDRYEEITADEYKSMVLPAVKTNGKWVKTDTFPKIEYPIVEKTTPTPTTADVLNTLLGV